MYDNLPKLRSTRYSRHRFLTQEEETALILEWKAGSKTAGDELVKAFKPLLQSQIALKSRRYPLLSRDAIDSAVHMGFAMALDKFKPEKGMRFAKYAGLWIRSYIQTEAWQSSATRPSSRSDQARSVFMAIARLKKGQGDLPLHEIYETVAKAENLDAQSVRKIHEGSVHIVSGDMVRSRGDGEDGGNLFDSIEDPAPQAADITETKNMLDIIQQAMGHLPEREKYILAARFGLQKDGRDEALTLEEIGNTFNISKERVRQLETRAIQMLRRQFQDLGFDMDDLILPSGHASYAPPIRHHRAPVPDALVPS